MTIQITADFHKQVIDYKIIFVSAESISSDILFSIFYI